MLFSKVTFIALILEITEHRKFSDILHKLIIEHIKLCFKKFKYLGKIGQVILKQKQINVISNN